MNERGHYGNSAPTYSAPTYASMPYLGQEAPKAKDFPWGGILSLGAMLAGYLIVVRPAAKAARVSEPRKATREIE